VENHDESGGAPLTPMQREELDLEIKHIDQDKKWTPYNRRITDGSRFLPWLCAALAIPIIIIIGAEIIFHVWALFK
jgi:hypothetical protein